MADSSLIRRSTSSNPLITAEPFWRGFDRLFNDPFFGDSLLTPFVRSGLSERGWAPPVDLRETDAEYVVTVELPGLTKSDVDVTVENNLLTISGERKWDDAAAQESYHRIERTYGRFSRSFTLPRQVDADAVKAKFQDGVLQLTLPKAQDARPRHIAIH